MAITPDTHVGEVVRLNFRTAHLLQENNIDYCCGGNKTLTEACAEAGVDSAALIAELEKVAATADPDTDFINSLELNELSDYIVRRHHSYVRKNIPFLKESLEKVCRKHGKAHPELFEIRQLFDGSAAELTMHMQKEEIVLFPYIAKMVKAAKSGEPLGTPPFGSVANPVRSMIAEHETEGARFDKIAGLSGGFAVPADACNTYRAMLSQLSEFGSDLHRHIHLENNILFPGAIRLEEAITGAGA